MVQNLSELCLGKAIQSLQTEECPSIAAAAQKYNMNCKTLCHRHKSQALSQSKAHEAQMTLNLAQEEAIVQWIGSSTAKGFPSTHILLQARVKTIKHAENAEALPLEKNYITKLVACHPRLGAAISDWQAKQRALMSSKAVYQKLFSKVAS